MLNALKSFVPNELVPKTVPVLPFKLQSFPITLERLTLLDEGPDVKVLPVKLKLCVGNINEPPKLDVIVLVAIENDWVGTLTKNELPAVGDTTALLVPVIVIVEEPEPVNVAVVANVPCVKVKMLVALEKFKLGLGTPTLKVG
jgi:hypothetical protein